MIFSVLLIENANKDQVEGKDKGRIAL